jgi:diguanylate cyclase (GGDEF)-like protein
MAASLVVAYVGASRITGPLSVLVGLVERVREGSYAEAVTIGGGGEIGTLAVAFDRMREGIASREAEIRRMALSDPLTGLPNRTLFVDRLEHALDLLKRGSGRLGVLMLDIDRFKDVNDTLGHLGGDHVLKEVAARLSNSLRAADTIARFDRDRFAVLLPAAGATTAYRVCRKIHRAFETPFMIGGQGLHLSVGLGVALGPDHGNDAETLIRRADQAMDLAKKNAAGFVAYDPTFERRESRLWLVEELREAIKRNELLLHYQPKADLQTGAVTQVEALVRWNHPRRGLVPPGQFIPLAEQTGLVRSLTRWVLDEALRQGGEWRRRGLSIEIAINISARDLLNPDLPGAIERSIKAFVVEPRNVRLEITESAIMEDPGQALHLLGRSKDLGLKLSIDDFGTGYSSLSNLRKLPVDELKIDRSFVMGMARERDDATIVQSTIDLGHNMGLKVVGEGVESRESWDLLRGLGCDLGQGYFLARALPARELEEWLSVRREALVS